MKLLYTTLFIITCLILIVVFIVSFTKIKKHNKETLNNFEEKCTFHLINLDKSTDRLVHFQKYATTANINFTRFTAVNSKNTNRILPCLSQGRGAAGLVLSNIDLFTSFKDQSKFNWFIEMMLIFIQIQNLRS